MTLASTLYAAFRSARGRLESECKVCHSRVNDEGELTHGKGCYDLSEDGGGSEWPDMAMLPWSDLDADERAAWERVAASALELCQPAIVGFRCACGRDHMFETREQVAIERDEAIRQRDEAQRAVRDGFPASVAVIRQQRDEAIAEVEQLKAELADADNELCRLTHHKRKRGCSIPDCRNYTPRAWDDLG